MENWWIYVVVFAGIILVFLFSAFIVKLLMNKAYKKAYALFVNMSTVEKERYDLIIKVKTTMENDGRFLPKNMVESTLEVEKEFEKIPCQIEKIKGMNDFLIIYYSKYIQEKKLMNKYESLEKELMSKLYSDPQDKTSPYYEYNKAALKYNAYLNMGFINVFKGGAQRLPTL